MMIVFPLLEPRLRVYDEGRLPTRVRVVSRRLARPHRAEAQGETCTTRRGAASTRSWFVSVMRVNGTMNGTQRMGAGESS